MDPSQRLLTEVSRMSSPHKVGLMAMFAVVLFSVLKGVFGKFVTIQACADVSWRMLLIYLVIVACKGGTWLHRVRQHATALFNGGIGIVRRGFDQNLAALAAEHHSLMARVHAAEGDLRRANENQERLTRSLNTAQEQLDQLHRTRDGLTERLRARILGLINSEWELREQLHASTEENARLLNDQQELEVQLQAIREENANLLEHQYDLEARMQGAQDDNVEGVNVQDRELNPPAVQQGLEGGDREGADF
ncbi:uncharacterized protein AB675_1677 [Cyphellophora attinorum]|uniref:Uncharacterized protein n=1 Tax=Cyphellophora attinorum TaxID=1664694 RepID=A0A0N1H558_9EURO|nr:uncharacterized protein AB675_1677 [Phialophora attinorum]KPI36046.1 hypothetical protein AB675_1677 [Phialophora attinorum]